MGKEKAMADLVTQRRNDLHSDPKYVSLSNFDGGFYDCEFVVPWTISAKNLDADLMIVAQDWASQEFLNRRNSQQQREKRKLTGQDEDLATNRNLKSRLEEHFGFSFSQTFATDVFVYVKPGEMNGYIPMRYLEDCAKRYTIPQIEIVEPRMVVCLGASTFEAVRCALGLPKISFSEACAPTAHTTYKGSEIYAVAHTGGQGTANAGSKDNVNKIWAGLAGRFRNLMS